MAKSQKVESKMQPITDSVGAILASLCALLIDRSGVQHGYMAGLLIFLASSLNMINVYHYKQVKPEPRPKVSAANLIPHTLMTEEELLKLPLIPRQTSLVFIVIGTNILLNALWSLTLTIYLYNVLHPYTVVTGALALVALIQLPFSIIDGGLSIFGYYSSLILSIISCFCLLIPQNSRVN